MKLLWALFIFLSLDALIRSSYIMTSDYPRIQKDAILCSDFICFLISLGFAIWIGITIFS